MFFYLTTTLEGNEYPASSVILEVVGNNKPPKTIETLYQEVKAFREKMKSKILSGKNFAHQKNINDRLGADEK